ncbi:hypothetical protein [Haloarcula nitratireducens]|uniref:Polysaccharide deacetylase n=1 Tax=Haloarcula nitratireducens TaxID=2487749 RepID=A0AAW4P8R3_9EURY|nr:hypothetical protein [Halomicroarcula nitratireducens]MBX0294055.1 hypothetical protein [Halomicroarcula nitratireducens]
MMRDFTDAAYASLLDTGLDAGYDFLTVEEYIRRETLPERFVILRHDVDRKPENSTRFAHIEAERDISSTYYVRTIDKVFDPQFVRDLAALGHEVGYHYEDLDRADGDVREARQSFGSQLALLRDHVDVDTVCMHGNPLTPHDNRDMWDDPADLEPFDVVGEAYLSMDFTDVTYFSDTGRTWEDGALKIKDHTMGEGDKRVSADSTADLEALLREGRVPRACLLTHPNRWADSTTEYVAETAKDAITNVGKRGLTLLR